MSFDLGLDFLDNPDCNMGRGGFPDADDLLSINTQDLYHGQETPAGRFAAPVSSEELSRCKAATIPEKTTKQTKWAVGVYIEWAKERNLLLQTQQDPCFPVPEELPARDRPLPVVDYWLQRFVVEARRKDGKPYPPGTLYNMVAALQRHFRDAGMQVDFFDKTAPTFPNFRMALDMRMKELTNEGVGTCVTRADPITDQDEKQLWDSGVVNMETSQGLSYAVFMYNCKAFGMRGRDEHRTLERSQYVVGCDVNSGLRYVRFLGRASKNVQGGLNQRKVSTKDIIHYEQAGNPRCIYNIFEKYLQHIPEEGPFYRLPLDGAHIKFSSQVIGKNALHSYIPKMFELAGIDTTGRRITNHSGKVTCCTTLYNAHFDDKAVTSRSGHRSNSVQLYKRFGQNKLRDISNALEPPAPKVQKVESKAKVESVVTAPSPAVQNEENEDDEGTLTITIPSSVKKVVLMRKGKVVAVNNLVI